MNKQSRNIILLPIIKIHFEINEASIPNQFHYFLLEAIRDKYSIDEIATAMLLKKDTIEKELSVLVKQGMLEYKDNSYCISDITRCLLELDQIVQTLNMQDDLYFDMISQRIIMCNRDEICLNDETTSQSLKVVGGNKLYRYASYLLNDFQTDIVKLFPDFNEFEEGNLDFWFNSISICLNEDVIWKKKYCADIEDVVKQDNEKEAKDKIGISGRYCSYDIKNGEKNKRIYVDCYSGEIYNQQKEKNVKGIKWIINLPVIFDRDMIEQKLCQLSKKNYVTEEKMDIQFIDSGTYEVACSYDVIEGAEK